MLLREAKQYLPLIKILQTALLILTGITGFISARGSEVSADILAGLFGSLFMIISGSTILNMVYDRDIDARMQRTVKRPLPSGKLETFEVFAAGIVMSCIGFSWALALSPLYAMIIFFGLFTDVVVYTMWLKRRTPWSIVWGGISGGMPILAGRALAIGQIDKIGILLAISILLWIPTHIMTFNMKYLEDYKRAGIPTFPSRYGFQATRWTIALSSFGAAIAIGIGSFALGLSGGLLWILAGLSIGIFALALLSLIQPSERINFGLFKFASLYMIGAMILLIIGT
ncbi:protoheme IX farnesyltransferase [candidate division KSB1 bacterium]|nr:protoheme IX farnesyltransferase [candidate division KSB1 bacterium]